LALKFSIASTFGISDFVAARELSACRPGELARTISQVESVETARVMIVMPENRLLVNDKNRPTASVFVKGARRSSIACASRHSHSVSW
jgi:flagellar M-ring protein FliF